MKTSLTLAGWAIALIAGSVGMWYYCLTANRLDERDFTTVSATVTSVRVNTSGGRRPQSYLEFHIKEKPDTRFRVPIETYEAHFERDLFGQNVHAGSVIVFKAEKAEMANPSRPPLDPEPTVFVHSIRDDQHVYATLAQHQAWLRQNNFYAMIFAVAVTLLALLFSAGFVVSVVVPPRPGEVQG